MSRFALVLARTACALLVTLALAVPTRAQIVMTSALDHQVERRCATPTPSLAERLAMVESAKGAAARWAGRELVVPVAYHVISADARTGNIPDERLDAQTDSLNRQFEGTGIRFVTLSVDRTQNPQWYSSIGLGSPLERTVKRELAIDPARVLNLYFANIDALGWCYFPSSFPEDNTQHGCFMATGSEPDGGLAPYDGGDTATHEIGHFFGLFHTFSNGGQECDTIGDLVDDTPAEAEPNFNGCDLMRDTCPDQPGFDPVTNFMDYSTDACLNDFTPGQVVRMQEQITTRKPTLLEGQTSGLGISRTMFSFGEVVVDELASVDLFVANFAALDGEAYSVVSATIDSDLFEVSFPEGLPIGPGQRLPLTVDFVATEGGEYEATLTVTTDDPANPTFEVAITATSDASAAVTTFPDAIDIVVDEGTTREALGLINSVGAVPLAFEFAPLAPTSFVTSISPASGEIEPGSLERISFLIDATTLVPGEYTETFTFTTNAPDAAELAFPINLTVAQVVSAEERGGPLAFALDGNFPNPFTPNTTIRFTLAEGAPTTLVVYDATGSEVHRLVDQTLAAGPHAVPFDASDLSSGPYFYRLVSGSNQATGSMVLLR